MADNTAAQMDFGGHHFGYESRTDLFRCSECRLYEVQVRATDGSIEPCKGLAAYGDDTERLYLRVTLIPDLTEDYTNPLAWAIRSTELGRCRTRRGRMLLVETAPSVVDELEREISQIVTEPGGATRRGVAGGRDIPTVGTIERLSGDAGRAEVAKIRAALAAERGA